MTKVVAGASIVCTAYEVVTGAATELEAGTETELDTGTYTELDTGEAADDEATAA